MATNSQLHRNEWEAFYDAHAAKYLLNDFTQFTVEEVDFFLSLFPLASGAKILDIGCGPGRHSIELAKRGFNMTAVDFSTEMIDQGKRMNDLEKLNINFICADATEYIANVPHDAAICLCEGAFNIVGSQEDPLTHDMSILQNIAKSLKTGAPFLFTALNGFASIRRLSDESIIENGFDPLTNISIGEDVWTLPEGKSKVTIKERLYIPSELASMLYHAGFKVLHLYGGSVGEWSRRPLKLDEIEMMFVCEKR